MSSRRSFPVRARFLPLVVSLALSAYGGARAEVREPGDRPNVLLILTDDQGWGDIGINGNREIETPVLDQLARDGARFQSFYVSPNCAPTRASLLTGRYHYRTGVTGVSGGAEVMRASEVTLAEVLKSNGYATGCFGKWHNGANYPHHPTGQGFDEFVGICQGHWNRYFDATLERNGTPYPTRGYVTDVLTDEALDFIERNRDHPFFCYVPYNTPHSPFQVPDRLFDKYKAKGLSDQAAAVYGMVESIDSNIGRLLDRLKTLNLEENTVVIFLSDNGPALGRKPDSQRYNGHLYGAKGSVHEGGVKVPCFIRWPGVIPRETVIHELSAHIDLLPSLVDLLGLKTLETLPLDGVNLAPLLRAGGTVPRWPNRLLMLVWTPPGHQVDQASLSARTGRWLLVRDPRWRRDDPKAKPDPAGEGTDEESDWELYDLHADPYQKHDVKEDYWYLAGHMAADISQWFKEVTLLGFDPVPTEIGHHEWPTVTLAAQDAVLSKGWDIRRGNNSWLHDWRTQAGDEPEPRTAEWLIDVVTPGDYEVAIDYRLQKAGPGAVKLITESGESRTSVTLSEPFFPPAMKNPDRVPRRSEAHEQEWQRISLPEPLRLHAGPSRLRVRLDPGAALPQGFELKHLILTGPKPAVVVE